MEMEMGLEANELPNFIIHDTISATPFNCHETTIFHHKPLPITFDSSLTTAAEQHGSPENDGGGGRRRRKKKRGFRNEEDVESQRMNHIAVERNRRKQMNHHLAALPSIIGGAIEFVKELEHLLQSLEAQKFLSIRQQDPTIHDENSNNPTQECEIPQLPLHFQKFFTCPQYTWSSIPNTNASKSNATMADIEVNLVQTHANLRILSRKRLKQLSKMVVFLQTCYLSILHLNVTTFDPFVLYSITLKVRISTRKQRRIERYNPSLHRFKVL
ncbi:Myc-type, basic helix-loop-helix (bHLH) domain-containing protein [Cynara cardunculus var. scolymus]|uniref:Myc-type, basic helix-loop-helix (BHLH) domain-containing protein n=1 Tax=Cynara cardunculus var. scolymus TaxID=59895 RepID=A0A103XJ35_CYNCS|nr:Myc-type, basic helix-loop-helix (bHLH) domain-containing protein [Cynara cardunculus var. scolymus]